MSLANAYEQYILETINTEREKVGAQPLAFNGYLNDASEDHSAWMDATDTLSHTGAGGSSPYDRMIDAGYVFSSTFRAYGENIAGLSLRSPSDYIDEIDIVHSFFMGSSGHRANILNNTFREIGIGFTVGHYTSYDSIFITQDFAATTTKPFLTGVAFDDQDSDKDYDINEGLGGLTVKAQNNVTGTLYTTQTGPGGGYALELNSGNYTVSFIGNDLNTQTYQVSIGSKNVKLDLVDPVLSTSAPEPEPDPTPAPTEPDPQPIPTEPASTQNIISGTSGSDILIGTEGNDLIFGFDGKDILYGGSGNDQIKGGNGNDILAGNAGADILTGDSGRDTFVFDATYTNGAMDTITDFFPKDDIIHLDNSIFTNLNTGRLQASAFHTGATAHAATDRIIYNAQTGSLYYDADGTGSASAQQFVELAAGLELTHFDFYVF